MGTDGLGIGDKVENVGEGLPQKELGEEEPAGVRNTGREYNSRGEEKEDHGLHL